jgi:hypothetical protein
LSIHIAAGGLAIVLGAVALLVKKGGTIHRRSGLLFVYSMLVLGATAALLGFRKRCDVLLVVDGPPPHVAGAPATRFDATHHSREVIFYETARLLLAACCY